jgi:hypothetical protein
MFARRATPCAAAGAAAAATVAAIANTFHFQLLFLLVIIFSPRTGFPEVSLKTQEKNAIGGPPHEIRRGWRKPLKGCASVGRPRVFMNRTV